jgi:hypothetical protein
MSRPDLVATGAGGMLLVGDTERPLVALVDPTSGERDEHHGSLLEVPHPSRAILVDGPRGGIWLGASDRPMASLVSETGDHLLSLELPGIPFGMALIPGGLLAVALKEEDAIAIVEPLTAAARILELPKASAPLGLAVATTPAYGHCTEAGFGADTEPASSAAARTSLYVTLAGHSAVASIELAELAGPLDTSGELLRSEPPSTTGPALPVSPLGGASS